jgi:hypothetical protein
MFKEELKKFVEDNPKLVTMRPAGEGIFVLKYTRRVFYDNLWNNYLEECRGTIVDADFNVVSRPFTKIYNYGVEANAPVLSGDTMVDAFRKVNGFMGSMTWHNGKLLVSTTGSTDSLFVDMIEELMGENRYKFEDHCEFYKDYTWMFECVHNSDPHIVPEQSGLYLLGYRKKTWDSVVERDAFALGSFAETLGTHRVDAFCVSMDKLQEMAKTCTSEGYVFYTQDGSSAKIKSPYYLTAKWVARNPRTNKLLTKAFKEQIDEEYYGLLENIRANIETYTALSEQERLSWVRDYLGN